MKIKFYISLALFIITLCVLWGYTSSKDKAEKRLMNDNNNSVKQERIDLHFGHQGVDDFITQQSGMDMHPVGMGFMDLYWSPPNLGKVRVMTENSDLAIDHIFKVTGIAFNQGSDEGIQDITIQSSLHHEEYISQRAAYHAYVELMTQLNEKGWQQYFRPWVAPIDKRDNLKYMRDPLYGKVIDPTYLLSYDEWRERRSIVFNLYHHEIRLSLTINRRFQDKESDREQYMMRYSFDTQRYFGRNMISDSHKMNAEELEKAFQQNQINDKKARNHNEIEMQEEGYRIDKTYVDHEIWQYAR